MVMLLALDPVGVAKPKRLNPSSMVYARPTHTCKSWSLISTETNRSREKPVTAYIGPVTMASTPWCSILTQKGGGPDLQAIALGAVLKKALRTGPNQDGLLLEVFSTCYQNAGITEDPTTWVNSPPTFAEVEAEIQRRITQEGCREARKLALKMAAPFKYGIFSRPQVPLDSPLVRVDLSKLPPAIQAIAAESLAGQLMDSHRLRGEMTERLPRTYLVIDEAKEMPRVNNNASDRIAADGRKYGLAAIWFSQSERHLSPEVLGNSSTKFVLPVDSTEVKKVANKFRWAEGKVAGLSPLVALCRLGKKALRVKILPYYQRLEEE